VRVLCRQCPCSGGLLPGSGLPANPLSGIAANPELLCSEILSLLNAFDDVQIGDLLVLVAQKRAVAIAGLAYPEGTRAMAMLIPRRCTAVAAISGR
jgi:hypothetical protein